jgi:diguanylate cyclase (GGDEF)-like protein/PAS domain S-box-containing protein
LLRPDVIKLDLRLVQQRASADIAEIVSAVNAEAERSGTAVLAEGIETEEHIAVARGLGATLGQGWLFGRAGALPEQLPEFRGSPVTIVDRPRPEPLDSPYQLAATIAPRSARKSLLIEVSKHLERQAMRAGEATVVLATFQDVSFFTPATQRRYTRLARSAAFVGALGKDMPAQPLPGVRGGVISAFDPLVGEWDIAVIGPHFAATLVARDLGDDGADADRRFEFVLSHDRELAIAVASSLMTRIAPQPRITDLPSVATGAQGAVPAGAPGAMPAVAQGAVLAGAPGGGSDQAARLTRLPARRADQLALVPNLLGRALDATRTGIAIADMTQPDMPLIYVNPGFEQITGYPAEQCLGRNCRFLQGPGTDPRAVAEMSDALRRRTTLSTRLLNYRADGSPFWNQLELHPVFDDAGRLTHYISVQDDITARVEAEAQVTYLAYHDQLTGLPNRALFTGELERALDRGARNATATALLFIDLDDFKQVNDQFGHHAGDTLLRRVAERLGDATRGSDILARLGGDEFVVLLSDLDPQLAPPITRRVAEQIAETLRRPVPMSDVSATIESRTVQASIGISIADPGETTPSELMQRADAAMYEAKTQAAL